MEDVRLAVDERQSVTKVEQKKMTNYINIYLRMFEGYGMQCANALTLN